MGRGYEVEMMGIGISAGMGRRSVGVEMMGIGISVEMMRRWSVEMMRRWISEALELGSVGVEMMS
jgi:hypothetical protein